MKTTATETNKILKRTVFIYKTTKNQLCSTEPTTTMATLTKTGALLEKYNSEGY